MPDPGRYRALAQAAEELGYDSIWAGDHISYRNPILDIVVALSTFAAVDGADHARRRDRAAAAPPPERGREGVRVPRLRLRRPADPRGGGRRRGREGLRGGRRRPARARRAHERGDARAAGAVRAGAGELLGPVLLVRGRRDRARLAAAGRAAALGRRPVRGGDPPRGGARRRLDPDLGVGRALRARARRSCPPHVVAGGHPARARRRRSDALYEHLRRRYAGDSPSTSSTATASPGRRRSAWRGCASTWTRVPGTSSSTSAEPEDAERLAEVARAAAG